MINLIIFLFVIAAIVLVLAFLLAAAWRMVIPPNEVHVIQRRKSTIVYGKGTDTGNVYYRMPSWIPYFGIMYKIMPVSIFKIPLLSYRAYDSKKAPFKVDVTAFFQIDATDAAKAAQRVSSFEDLYLELEEVLRGAVRKILASNNIEQIMTERSILGDSFLTEVKTQVSAWGVNVLNIEFMDIADDDGNELIISAIMRKHSSFIKRKSEEEVAINEKEAKIVQITAKKEADVQAIHAEEAVETRDAEKKQKVGIANELADQNIQLEKKNTAEKEMAVLRVMEVEEKRIQASARIEEADGVRQSTIKRAEGEKEAQALEGQGLGKQAAAIGAGEASAIREKGLAEAEAKEKMADALSRFQEKGLLALLGERAIEKDEAVGVAISKAYQDAQIKVIQTGEADPKNLLDLVTKAGSGAKIGGMLEGLKETLGIDLKDLVNRKKSTSGVQSDKSATTPLNRPASSAHAVDSKSDNLAIGE